MPHYRRLGFVPRKRHTLARHPVHDTLLHEELMGLEGFSASSSLVYHRRSPSAIVAARTVDDQPDLGTFDAPLLPRHIRTGALPTGGDLITGRQPVLANDDVVISYVAADGTSPLYRNATGDELVFVQSGRALLESTFGELDVGAGDYVVIPMGTTHRWCVAAGAQLDALVLECRTVGHVRAPKRYLTDQGQFVEGAPYCERDLRTPTELIDELDAAEQVEVLVRHQGGVSAHVHAHHPFDVVGWDGTLYPYALNIADFEPIVGQIHQPPPVHQTFEGPGFVVCSFVPRPYDFHPEAIKVPYHHANVDSDEILFYSQGDFMSRAGSGIGQGSISFHPAGFVHGPQPGSAERAAGADRTEEYAVMIDTFRRLRVTEAARAASDEAYAWSWART